MTADISAVTPPAPDPKLGVAKPKSAVSFPYYSLSSVLDLARVLHEKAGGQCGRVQLAHLLGYSGVKNGGFLSRVSAAKMFGIVEEHGDTVRLTERAKEILYPVHPAQAEQALLDAFLDVALYRRVFEAYEGQTLPGQMGLKNLFLNTYKIVPKQVDGALRTMMDSAETAGLFRMAGNRSKMIRPIIANTAGAKADPAPPEQASAREDAAPREQPTHRRKGGSDGGDGRGEHLEIHPALIGLLRGLPTVGEKLPPKRRAALVEAFKSTVNFIWPEEEES